MDEGVLPVVGSAALATAKGTSGVGSAGGANTATAVVPEALGPGVYGGAGGGGNRCENGHCMARPGMGSMHRCERGTIAH